MVVKELISLLEELPQSHEINIEDSSNNYTYNIPYVVDNYDGTVSIIKGKRNVLIKKEKK